MEMNDRGELYVCKNPSPATSSDRPGLLVFGTANDALLAGPLNTGLPPICVTFDHATDAVLSVPDAPRGAGIALSGPWPNPTRGSARIALRLPSASRVDATIVDLAGRTVRRMEEGGFAAGERTLVWDLRDDSGRDVPAGLYFVRVAVDGVASSRRLAVIR
jgi:hypothetical protein